MNRRIQTIVKMLLIAVVAGLLCSPITASAQHVVQVSIPFEFVANDHYMPAGNYLVKLVSDSNNNKLIFSDARTGTNRALFMVRTEDTYGRTSRSGLVFQVIGTTHILSKVSFAKSSLRSALSPSPHAALEIAKNHQPSSVGSEVAMK